MPAPGEAISGIAAVASLLVLALLGTDPRWESLRTLPPGEVFAEPREWALGAVPYAINSADEMRPSLSVSISLKRAWP